MARRRTPPPVPPGYFGIGVDRPRHARNLGTLWRSAQCFDASLLFTVQAPFPPEAKRNLVGADPALGQPGDTWKAWRAVPYLTFPTVAALHAALPLCTLVGVELADDAVDLRDFEHPEQALYLLGSEIDGLRADALAACDAVIRIPTPRSLNVASAGTVVLYDRLVKRGE